jgi:deoxyribose-phosphate aldolase
MEVGSPEPRPPLAAYEQLAALIEHSAMRPELAESDIHQACEIARHYRVAAVCVRPSDVDLAVRWMEGSEVAVASVVGFPHGSDTTSAKLYATRDLLRRGAREIDTVLNIGKMISRQFQYIETELAQMAEACHENNAVLKVAFENGYLSTDHKTIACKICRRAGVDYARTSTPFGPAPFSIQDIALMRRLLKERVKIKASGGVRTLDDALSVYEAGADRVGTIATVTILEAWRERLKVQATQA